MLLKDSKMKENALLLPRPHPDTLGGCIAVYKVLSALGVSSPDITLT